MLSDYSSSYYYVPHQVFVLSFIHNLAVLRIPGYGILILNGVAVSFKKISSLNSADLLPGPLKDFRPFRWDCRIVCHVCNPSFERSSDNGIFSICVSVVISKPATGLFFQFSFESETMHVIN